MIYPDVREVWEYLESCLRLDGAFKVKSAVFILFCFTEAQDMLDPENADRATAHGIQTRRFDIVEIDPMSKF